MTIQATNQRFDIYRLCSNEWLLIAADVDHATATMFASMALVVARVAS